MMGMDFAVRTANDRKLPLSVCLGIGSSQGAHIGKNPLSIYVDYASQFSLISASIAAGNEGAARHHYAGRLTDRENQASAELRVGNKEPGFTMEFWGEPPEIYNLSLQTPTGEILDIHWYIFGLFSLQLVSGGFLCRAGMGRMWIFTCGFRYRG